MKIHGYCASIGCLAMSDYIDVIYTIVSSAAQNGQSAIPMHLFPFPMRQATLEKALLAYPQHVRIRFGEKIQLTKLLQSTWWNSIKPGYDFFELTNIPPKVSIVIASPPAYLINQVSMSCVFF